VTSLGVVAALSRRADPTVPTRRACLLVGVMLVSFQMAALAAWMEVKVVGVTDGDTLVVLEGGKVQHRVRLAGIDAPEKYQAFGARAHQALASAVFRRTVMLEWHKKDRYGRLVAKVTVADRDIGLELIAAGLAWHYKAYEREQSQSDRHSYSIAESLAKQRAIGLWSATSAIPPWEFRRSR
jgi:endonuclease YncB( thermonuclease family)